MEENSINDILGIKNSKSQSIETSTTNRHRYPALRTISRIYMVLAWLIGIASIIATLYFLSEESEFGFVSIIVGGLLALGLAAISESIKVFLDIEYNTRKESEK
jgi:VIT1/CCC1 family predicted Fe2+/Mn2+ transporter